MKKFLALVLALVMTMSLVTISAGAEFTDADEVTYDEAVEVMTALGVVTGDTSGAFNPTAGLTRGAAAKIICNMILGVDVASALNAAEAPFADVPVNNVFAGYIAYCAQEGIVSGYADGTFKPADPLTGYAFIKMLLGALGYDADVEGLVGSNWGINVAKLAKQRDLTKGNEDYVGSKAITREEAMLYAFNTMLSETVVYDGASNSTITIGDIVIKNNGKAVYDTKPLFYKASFGKLDLKGATMAAEDSGLAKITVSSGSTDDFGRDAYTWFLNKDEANAYNKAAGDVVIGEYAVKADYSILVTGTKNDTLAEIAEDLDIDLNSKSGSYNKGEVVEIFVDTDNKIVDTVVLATKLAKVSKVVAASTKETEFDYTVTLKIGSSMVSYKDTELEGFDVDTMVKDTYVLYTAGSTTAIVAIPEVVTGSQTAYGTGYTKIAGEKVEKSYHFWAVDALNDTDTFNVYCDANGYAVGSVKVEDAEEEVKIFYVEAFQMDAPATAFDTQKAKASVVYLDGTEAVLDVDVYTKNSVKYIKVADADVAFVDNCITTAGYYAYTLNADGEISNLTLVDNNDSVEDWKVASQVIFTAEKSHVDFAGHSSYYYANNKTTVTTMKDEKATVVTGYADFTTTTYAAPVLFNCDGNTVLSVYVYNVTAMAATDDTVYGWYVETGDTYKNADDVVVTDVVYNVAGVDTTYTITGTTVNSAYKQLVAIDVTDGIAALSAAGTANAKLAYVDEEYVLLNGTPTATYFADDVKFYDVTDVEENGVVELDELVKNSIVTYTVNTKSPAEITGVYVVYAGQDDGVLETLNAVYLEKVIGFDAGTSAAAVANDDVVIQFTADFAEGASSAAVSFVLKNEAGTTIESLSYTKSTEGIGGIVFTRPTTADTYTYTITVDGVAVSSGSIVID